MAKNREMLKEAIAEAKAVKEAAIANAKVALEEAFTPQLKSMLSMKLQEMEEETNEAMYEEDDTDDMNEETSEPHGNIGASTPEGEVLGFNEEEDKDMMEVDLEELLAELELEEGEEVEETLNEAEEEEAEEDEEEGEEEEEGDTEMEDLSDDELKEMIEDVIAQMIKDGELEAGPEFEGEEEGEEMEMDAEEEEEVDLAELLKEIEEMEKDEIKEEKEEVNELVGRLKKFLYGAAAEDPFKVVDEYYPGLSQKLIPHKGDKDKIMQIIKDETDLLSGGPISRKMSDDMGKTKGSVVGKFLEKLGIERDWSKMSSGGSFTPYITGEGKEMKAELDEAYKTIDKLRSELNEINLLNAKLLYTNKIFKSKNLNENQKVKVLSSFDKAKNVGEVKMVFETLNEGIKVKKDTIKENLGRASKATTIPTTKKPIVESNDVFLRMQKLAGIIK